MDKDLIETIKKDMKMTAGTPSLEVDGVTINSKSRLLYTISKGEFSLFHCMSCLDVKVHDHKAEVEDGLKIVGDIEESYSGLISNIAGDNAATPVIKDIIAIYLQENPEHPPITNTRDPSHCLDLLAKDSAKLEMNSTWF
jgi:hypothetical protein